MITKEIREGNTRLIVQDTTDIPENCEVFYNPKMHTNRSISSLLLRIMFKKARVADVMCGLGARAVRYANEGGFEVYANDVQPSAVKLCQQNAELNNVKVETSVCEANVFLMNHKKDKFDFVDIDPFGSPAPFLNSSIFALEPNGGVLGATATDIGTLAGIYPKACMRKYGTVSDRNSFMHELGIRNLIASISREASKHDYSISPVFSYNEIHYDRVFVQTGGGRKTNNRDLKNIGYIKYCKKCERREMIPVFEDYSTDCECGERAKIFGLTWIGKIADPDFLDAVQKDRKSFDAYDDTVDKYLKPSESEYAITTPYYRIADITSIYKKESKRAEGIIEALNANGYKAYFSHFEQQALKTDAPYKDVVDAILRKSPE